MHLINGGCSCNKLGGGGGNKTQNHNFPLRIVMAIYLQKNECTSHKVDLC